MAFEKLYVPPMFNGCTFSETTWFDGTMLSVKDEPEVLGDPARGNIVFPKDWSENQRMAYRMAHNLPGAEWPR